MASFRVEVKPSARKELTGLPDKLIARILPRLENLASNPRPSGCKKLKGGDNDEGRLNHRLLTRANWIEKQ